MSLDLVTLIVLFALAAVAVVLAYALILLAAMTFDALLGRVVLPGPSRLAGSEPRATPIRAGPGPHGWRPVRSAVTLLQRPRGWRSHAAS